MGGQLREQLMTYFRLKIKKNCCRSENVPQSVLKQENCLDPWQSVTFVAVFDSLCPPSVLSSTGKWSGLAEDNGACHASTINEKVSCGRKKWKIGLKNCVRILFFPRQCHFTLKSRREKKTATKQPSFNKTFRMDKLIIDWLIFRRKIPSQGFL